MLTHDPAALKLLLTDDLYLLRKDRQPQPPVIATATDPAIAPSDPATIPLHLGPLSNGCLIVVDEPGQKGLAPETREALMKTFTRCGLQLGESGLVNLAHQPVGYEEIVNIIRPKKILLLGVDALAMGFDKLAYNTPLLRDGMRLLYTYKMSEMLHDGDRKKHFWEGFKATFQV